MPKNKVDPLTAQASKAFLQKLEGHFNISKAILFGSRARLDYTDESDADIALLISDEVGQFVDTKLQLDDYAYEVLLDTGIRIQPIPIWQDEWFHPEHYPNPALIFNTQFLMKKLKYVAVGLGLQIPQIALAHSDDYL